MKFKNLRWYTAALVAFLMGVPMAEKAMASDVGGIAGAITSLIDSIVNAAGNS